jgi:hypothetical protein
MRHPITDEKISRKFNFFLSKTHIKYTYKMLFFCSDIFFALTYSLTFIVKRRIYYIRSYKIYIEVY